MAHNTPRFATGFEAAQPSAPWPDAYKTPSHATNPSGISPEFPSVVPETRVIKGVEEVIVPQLFSL